MKIIINLLIFLFILPAFSFGEINKNDFKEYIIQFEGKRNIPYRDICDCQWNVGIAHRLFNPTINNLNRKYSNREIEAFFQKDLAISIKAARININNFDSLSNNQQMAILNIIYSCGPTGFSKWIKFRKAVENSNFRLAQEEILDSKWANEVQPNRKWSVYNLILN